MSDEKENAVGAKVLAAERCVAAVMEQRPGWLNVTPTAVATAAISDRITPPVPSPVVLSLEQKVADAICEAVCNDADRNRCDAAAKIAIPLVREHDARATTCVCGHAEKQHRWHHGNLKHSDRCLWPDCDCPAFARGGSR